MWTVSTYDLSGATVVADLPVGDFSFIHSLDGPGSFEADFKLPNISRDDVEPGQRDYKVFQDGTLRAEGRIWTARIDTNYDTRSGTLVGEGIGGILRRRIIDWEARYEKNTEDPPNLNTQYELSQEEIAFDQIYRSQLEDGGDLGITMGSLVGSPHKRRRWYCIEDGLVITDVLDGFAELSDGFDWAITPTLTDTSSRVWIPFNPSRGNDLSGSVTLDGTAYLDTLAYEIDAGAIVSRAHARADGECDPFMGDETNPTTLADYGLLEAFTTVDSEEQEDADEAAIALLDSSTINGQDVYYELSRGPALGTFDVGDTVMLVSDREGWELNIPVRVQEVEVKVQMPENVFVRVNFALLGEGS